MFYKKKVLRENHVNRESTSLEFSIQIYICYEHESLQIFNTTVYLSRLLHLEDVMGWKVHSDEHEKLWLLQC